jgi:two-component system, chemotaxis family, chemotaxis protein CheV
MSNVASKAHQSQGILMFKLNHQQQLFAIGTLKIREIISYMPMTQIPYSHHDVIGTVTVRNMTIPVIDMAAAIGFRRIDPSEYKQCFLIVTDCLRTVVAFMVRSIEKIVECNWRAIEPAPRSAGDNIFVTGITRFEDQLVQLLDVELLLSKIYPQSESSKRAILSDVDREKLKPFNIMLVDDSAIARKQLSDALDHINIPYLVCKTGNDALVRMRELSRQGNGIDILVSDIEMPGLDGYELTFEVRNDALISHAYIILHTSLSSEICLDRAKQVGAQEALEKFNAHELVHAMLRGANELTMAAQQS